MFILLMGGDMLARLFESQDRKAADAAELERLQRKFGDALLTELRARVDRTLPDARSRKHWQRLLRKARQGNGGASKLNLVPVISPPGS